jgi:hypothetical protein
VAPRPHPPSLAPLPERPTPEILDDRELRIEAEREARAQARAEEPEGEADLTEQARMLEEIGMSPREARDSVLESQAVRGASDAAAAEERRRTTPPPAGR